MPKKSQRFRLRKPTLRESAWLLLGFCLPFFAYIVYLNHQVTAQFEGKRFSLPAKVYARPLELYPGQRISAAALRDELKLLNYKKVAHPETSGEFVREGNRFMVFTRPFTYWDGRQEARLLTITINGGSLSEVSDLETGAAMGLIRLDPIAIGGIYPNKGEDRQLVRLHQVPPALVNALIAIEDKRFYEHHGVDPKAVLRAISTIFSGSRIQGGSTITQQLVKNFYLTQERTITRKLKEMVMALLLELHYDKADILETYINEVYFGQDKNRAIHGFGLASQFYFSRSIEHLEVEQAALLVGLLKGPAYYNPRKHPERARARRDLVLKAMAEQGYIEDAQLQLTRQQALKVSPLPDRGQSLYPAFMDLVIRQLSRDYREEDLRSEGLRIFTTLDPHAQRVAEKALSSRLKALEAGYKLPDQHLQGALVLVNTLDGEVTAVVGDRNSDYQGFNRALDASRQIGSLLKPAIYLTALANTEDYHLASVLDDSPFSWSEPGIDDWQPENYDREFHGDVPLWMALAKSYNVAAARLGTEIGVEQVMRMVQRLGVDKELPPYASSLLGTVHLTPYEVAQMYHTLASGGFRTPFRAIREVTTLEGEPLKRYDLQVESAISATPNYLLVNGLQQVVKNGTGVGLKRYLPENLALAGKTGTTDELRDSWFAGFSGDKVAVVWVGNDNNESINLTGATGALTVWGEMMAGLSPQPIDLPMPENVQLASVDRSSGFLAVSNCRHTFELPFAQDSLPDDTHYCSGRPANKIKSWFKRMFGDRQ